MTTFLLCQLSLGYAWMCIFHVFFDLISLIRLSPLSQLALEAWNVALMFSSSHKSVY